MHEIEQTTFMMERLHDKLAEMLRDAEINVALAECYVHALALLMERRRSLLGAYLTPLSAVPLSTEICPVI